MGQLLLTQNRQNFLSQQDVNVIRSGIRQQAGGPECALNNGLEAGRVEMVTQDRAQQFGQIAFGRFRLSVEQLHQGSISGSC